MKVWYTKDLGGMQMAWLRKPAKWCGYWIGSGGAIIAQDELPEGVRPEWEDENPIEVNYKTERNGKD